MCRGWDDDDDEDDDEGDNDDGIHTSPWTSLSPGILTFLGLSFFLSALPKVSPRSPPAFSLPAVALGLPALPQLTLGLVFIPDPG